MARAADSALTAWLEELGLGQYARAFHGNDIDLAVLPDLTADDLREIGVDSVGHRRRILSAAANLRRRAPAPQEVVPPEADGASQAAERRTVTVMFCDLVGSTEFAAAGDAEDYRDFIAQFRNDVEAAIRPFGATISQFLGDGIMASFGYPVASGHDAERAVAAGLAAVEAVAHIAPYEGRQPQLRVGIATGLAVVGALEQGLSVIDDSGIIGETPNLAARLQSFADPGGVVISDHTRALIGDIFECVDLGEARIKGLAEPVHIWNVRGRSSAASRYDAMRAARRGGAFVGRAAEFAELSGLTAAMRAGTGRMVLISGDTGIGKSRLAREVLAAEGVKHPVLLQCSPYGVGVPFFALRSYVSQAAGLQAREEENAAVARLATWLGATLGALPELGAEVLAAALDLAPPGEGPIEGIGPVDLRARVMTLFGQILRREVARAGALIVEDTQWIDPSTAEVLKAALPGLYADRLLTLGTAHPGPLPLWLVDVGADILRLTRLDSSAITRLVRGLAEGTALSAEITEALVARSDGVPLFAEELVRGFLDSGGRPDDGDPLSRVPVSLAESLLARIDRLVHGRRIASIAAAIGREIPVSILTAVTDLPANVVHAGIGELLAADVIVPTQSRFGEAIRFRHNLVREAAYDLLLRRQRTVLHARIADTLTGRFPDIAAAVPHVVAIQRAAAGQYPAAETAWERAGQAASKRSAYAEAAGFFQSAIDLALTAEPGAARDERELALRLALATALISCSDSLDKKAADEVERVVALGRKLGSSERMVPAIHLHWVRLLSSNEAQAARDFAYQLLDATAHGPEADRLIAMRCAATSNLFCGDLRRALGHYQDFMELFVPARHAEHMRVGHSDHSAIVMMGLAETHTLMGNRAEAISWRERALAYARASTRVFDRCHTLTFAGCLHPYLLGEYAVAERHARELDEVTRPEPIPAFAGMADLFLGAVAIRRGDRDSGLPAARRGAELLLSHRVYHNFWTVIHAELCLLCKQWEDARQALEHGRRMMAHGDVRFRPELLRLEAALLADRDGDVEEAGRRLDEAAALAEVQGAGLFAGRIAEDQAKLAVRAQGAAAHAS